MIGDGAEQVEYVKVHRAESTHQVVADGPAVVVACEADTPEDGFYSLVVLHCQVLVDKESVHKHVVGVYIVCEEQNAKLAALRRCRFHWH